MPQHSANSAGLSISERVGKSISAHVKAMDIASKRLRVAIPGVIRSFDAAKQTVVVQPAIMENVRVAGVLQAKALPLLVDVPLVLPRAGNYVLTMPVTAGDECLVVFADMCIDAWYQLGAAQAVQNPQATPTQMVERRHDLSDAFAVLGCWSQPNVLANYSTTSAQLRSKDGTVKVDIAANAVTVNAPTVNVTGQTVNVTGSSQVAISGNNNTTIEGRNFLTHTHSGVASGGATSGPVV